MKYVNTNAEGLYSLSGSIFLDSKNSKDFTDFNNILYGHHMEKKTMFGEIGFFSDENVFNAHRYGNLYFDGKDHGIEFFAFTHTNAYDGVMFKANASEDIRHVYLGRLLETAKHKREIGITTEDRIVLLTTCSSASTNGRDILAGRITDKTFEDPFIKADVNKKTGLFDKDKQYGLASEVLLWLPLLILIIIARLIYILVANLTNKNINKKMTESRNY
jgi:sortase B